eukprot:scaffold4749_cov137-Isochrysis_galbana.AAC.9
MATRQGRHKGAGKGTYTSCSEGGGSATDRVTQQGAAPEARNGAFFGGKYSYTIRWNYLCSWHFTKSQFSPSHCTHPVQQAVCPNS